MDSLKDLANGNVAFDMDINLLEEEIDEDEEEDGYEAFRLRNTKDEPSTEAMPHDDVEAAAAIPEESNDLFGDEDSGAVELIRDEVSVVQPPEDNEPAYNFRSSARTGGSSSTFVTFLDNDDSGTYDPNAPALTSTKSEPKPNRREGESLVDYQLRLRANRLGFAASRANEESLVVTFRVTSDVFRSVVANIPDNWAPLHWNVLSDDHTASILTSDNSTDSRSYALRKRAEPDSAPKDGPSGSARVPDPARLEEDLFAHPAARGCVACRKFALHNPDIKCPLLEADSTWPCNFCIEDNVDCELITPPYFKNVCENCKRKKLPCSYREKRSESSMPCWECQDTKSPCVAGPAPGAVRERISYDRDYSKKPDRRYVQCTACRKDHKSCSLKSKNEAPPCNRCVKQGFGCTFEPLPRAKRASAKHKATNNIVAAGSEVAKSNSAVVTAFKEKHKGEIPANAVIIATSLCYPVTFMYEAARKCHWCRQPSYGHLGIGWREVLVVPDANETSFHELERGHSNDREASAPSRMCIKCTMERTRIIGCEDHELRPIETLVMRARQRAGGDLDEDNYVLDQSAIDPDAMFARLTANRPLPADKWCSLCPSPALYRCCTPQETDMWGEQVSAFSAEASGCGLLLCEDCTHAYNEVGELETVLDMIVQDRDHEVWGLGPRADAEFLKREGLLLKNVLQA